MKYNRAIGKTTGGRIMAKKVAIEGGMSRAEDLGTWGEKSLQSDNVSISNQKLLALVILHRQSLNPSVAIFYHLSY